jgi:hypothetical protein
MNRIQNFLAVVLLALMSLGAHAQQRTDELATSQGPSAGQERSPRQDRAGRAGGAATLREANQAARDGDLPRARALIDEVLQRQPDNARAHFVKAQIAARDNDAATARSELEVAEKLAPGLTFAREQAVANLRKKVERLEARDGRAERPRAGRNARERNARDRDAAQPTDMPAESRTPPNEPDSTNTAGTTPSAPTAPTAGSAGSAVETRPAGEDTRNMGAAERKVQGFGLSNQLIIGVLIGAVIAVALMALLRRRRSTQA